MSSDDFYAPDFKDIEVERKNGTKTFRIRELTGEEAEAIFDINDKDGKVNQAKAKGLNARIIALAVTDVVAGVPQAITQDQANKMPAKFRDELVKEFLAINSIDKQSGEDKEQD